MINQVSESMGNWFDRLLVEVHGVLEHDPYWKSFIPLHCEEEKHTPTIHLAIFVEPYLSYILEGSKTVESRFTQRRTPPFDKVNQGDIILLKLSGGPVIGICEVGDVWHYHLDAESWREIKNDYSNDLKVQDPEFWRDRKYASFATLMRIRKVKSIPPIRCAKRDRRGWVTYNNRKRIKIPSNPIRDSQTNDNQESNLKYPIESAQQMKIGDENAWNP